MKPDTSPRPATEPISERDAAWFEELADAVERGRAGLAARMRPGATVSDTAMSLVALADAGQASDSPEVAKAVRRLVREERQLGADETALLLLALRRSGHALRAACGEAVFEGISRLLDAQNRDGGWPSLDAEQPVEASCQRMTALALEALGHFGFRPGQQPVGAAVRFLLAHQEDGGSWRDLAGTSQVLCGLQSVGFDMTAPVVRRAVRWLKEAQTADGGWGEAEKGDPGATARALLGLLAAGDADCPEVRAGAEFLVGTQRADGSWTDEVLPLIALARYASAMGAVRTRRDSGHTVPAPKALGTRVFAEE